MNIDGNYEIARWHVYMLLSTSKSYVSDDIFIKMKIS